MHRRGPGSFCWFDLKTHDVAATGAALSTDLGWSVTEPRRLRAAVILSYSEHPVASLSDLSNPVYPAGIPEHIAWYLAVDDLDARTRAALAAGAELVVEPFELPGLGAMSTIIDPFGAAVSLWEQHGFSGWTHPPRAPRTPSAPHHHGPDPAAARDFYSALGLDDPAAAFVHDSNASWTARITALPNGSLRTPGGTSLHST
jgi:predicted enzyme related to lactoylglutathione lyase